MTWVVAISGFPSGGVAAADVRITLDYGGRREYPEDVGVQKIHAVTRHVAVGFSGAIPLGFNAVSATRSRWHGMPPNHAAWPREVAERLSMHMRRRWTRYDQKSRSGGCELLVLGWVPQSLAWYRAIPGPRGEPIALFDEASKGARSQVFVMRADHFEVEEAAEQTVVSIGARVPAWTEEIARVLATSTGLDDRQLGLGVPVLAAEMLREATQLAMDRVEDPTVSRFMQFVSVGPQGVMIGQRPSEAPDIAADRASWGRVEQRLEEDTRRHGRSLC